LALSSELLEFIILAIIFHGLTIGGIYGLISASLTVVYGGLSFPNLALGSYLNVSAYVIYYLVFLYGIAFFPSLAIDMGIFFVVFLALEFGIFRRFYATGNPAIILLAVSLGIISFITGLYNTVLSSSAVTLSTVYSMAQYHIGLFTFSQANILSLVIEYGLVVALLYFMRYTSYGRALRAMSQDKEAAALMGANIIQLSTLANVMASMVAVVEGAMYALVFSFDATLGATLGFVLFAMVLVGGAGSVYGCTIIGLLYGFVDGITNVFFQPVWTIYIFFGLLFITLFLRPQGLFTR
jgi:branched-chain amino acid transport system permease protein